MEDWSYAGSWENEFGSQYTKQCTPQTLGGNFPVQETTYNSQQLRSFTYLVEADDRKIPPESTLGNPNGIESISKLNTQSSRDLTFFQLQDLTGIFLVI